MVGGALAVLFVVLAGHLSLYPRVADLDGFYHVGHAAAYLERSLFDTSLPWATRSIIRDVGADLWWGFHVLLTPLAALDDPAVAVRIAALLLTAGLGGTVFWVLRRHGVPGAAWWTAAFLLAVPNVSFRFLMLRPHVISLAASLALLSVLVRGRWWQALLLAALIGWVHVTLFWVAPGIVAAFVLARLPIGIAAGPSSEDRSVPIGGAFAAVLAGTVLGWLLRPHPLATAHLIDVQLVWLFAQKAADLPLTFSAELSPIGIAELTRTTWLFLLLWLVGLALTGRAALRGIVDRLGEERATLLTTSAMISAVFLALAVLTARRAMVQWVLFGFVLLPLSWGFLLSDSQRRRVRIPLVALAALHMTWAGWRHTLNVTQVAFPGATLAEAAGFLAAESRPGDLVFHARWDNFGPLLARDRKNHYLGGMDPIFQYAHDPSSYWEFFFLSADLTSEYTCDAFPCASGTATDTHTVLRDHFGARWVLVEPRRNPRLTLYLLNDDRFRLALETQREAVFEVRPDATGAGPAGAAEREAGDPSGRAPRP